MEPEKNEISVDFFLATQDFDSTIFLLLLFFVSLSFSFFYTLRHIFCTQQIRYWIGKTTGHKMGTKKLSCEYK